MSIQWHRLPTAQEAAEACAQHILMLLTELTAGGRPASFAISGGSSPKSMFGALAKAEFPWELVHIFWVDERCVPPTDKESNYRLAQEYLIDPAAIPRRNLHRIAGELRPEAAAHRYVDEIREFFGLEPGELPRFDIIHRGMGPDAHTASLFPGEPLIEDRQQIAAAVYAKKFDSWRVTLLPGVLLAARHTLMLVTGEDKSPALRSVCREEYSPLQYPAQLGMHDSRGLVWFIDESAANLID